MTKTTTRTHTRRITTSIGSVTTILKPNATIEQGYTYDEFGNSETVSETSLLKNEVSYTGAISDSTTGLTYMNARYYNPAIGSFTSDTYLGSAYNPWTQHLYSYTGGNPINLIDATGHRFVKGADIGGHLEPSTQSYKEYEEEQFAKEQQSIEQDVFEAEMNFNFNVIL